MLKVDLDIFPHSVSCLQYKCFVEEEKREFAKPHTGFPITSFLLFNKKDGVFI